MNRRTYAFGSLGLLLGTSACEGKPMKVVLDVVLFSYLDRPIFDVLLAGTDIGVAGAYPASGMGSMTGVELRAGPQKLSWRLDGPKGMARNGETVQAKNQPVLDGVERDHRFLGVHIYDDDTVELISGPHFPRRSERGEAYAAQWRARNGQ